MAFNLLGSTLRQPDGSTVETKAALQGKEVVGLYFSAHWCPPCRGFTPELSKKYTALKAAGKSVEIVFVSSDSDENSFKNYHKEMTFLALPYSERAAKDALSKMFKVSGIPTLVFLDGQTGAVNTADGREVISEGDFIAAFPYRPRPVNVIEELGATLRKPGGSTVATSAALQGVNVLGLYFSAHWCPPCQRFTPSLSQKYTQLKQAGKSVEIVFVSSDKDDGAFKHYHDTMSFLALPYEARDAKGRLSKHFKVEGIPTLVFLDATNGKVITTGGRSAIDSASFLEDFPYWPKPVNDIASNTEGIQDEPCLVVLLDKCSKEVQASVSALLTPIAEEELKKEEGARAVQKFFVALGPGTVLEQLRAKCGYPAASAPTTPQLLILDLPSEGAYYHPGAAEVSAASVRTFMQQFAKGDLKRRTFGQ